MSEKEDRQLLMDRAKHGECISAFWITETMARAKRIESWQESGALVLDGSPGFPLLRVKKFNPKPTRKD